MPDWIISTLVFMALMFGLGFLFNPDKKTKAKLNELFLSRPIRTDNDYYEEFFVDSDIPFEVVSKIRAIFSEQFGVDLRALEADDDLSKDYSLIWDLDSLADVEIIMALEADFEIEISDEEAARIRSIRTISEIVALKIEEKKRANKTLHPTASS